MHASTCGCKTGANTFANLQLEKKNNHIFLCCITLFPSLSLCSPLISSSQSLNHQHHNFVREQCKQATEWNEANEWKRMRNVKKLIFHSSPYDWMHFHSVEPAHEIFSTFTVVRRLFSLPFTKNCIRTFICSMSICIVLISLHISINVRFRCVVCFCMHSGTKMRLWCTSLACFMVNHNCIFEIMAETKSNRHHHLKIVFGTAVILYLSIGGRTGPREGENELRKKVPIVGASTPPIRCLTVVYVCMWTTKITENNNKFGPLIFTCGSTQLSLCFEVCQFAMHAKTSAQAHK